MTTTRNGHLSSRVWSPTNLRMVTHQKDVYCRLGIWHLDLEVCYGIGIWNLDLTNKIRTRSKLLGMVTRHP